MQALQPRLLALNLDLILAGAGNIDAVIVAVL